MPGRLLNITFCILLCANIFAQTIFTGKVPDQQTTLTVASARIYRNNTSIGIKRKEAGLYVGGLRTGTRPYPKLNGNFINNDRFGLPENPRNIAYSGYLANEIAASMLPYNYFPDKN